jgi:hypothetical protein
VGFTGVSISAKNEIFFRRGLDHPNQLEFVREISIYVKSNSRPAGRMREAIAAPDLPVGQINVMRRVGAGRSRRMGRALAKPITLPSDTQM